MEAKSLNYIHSEKLVTDQTFNQNYFLQYRHGKLCMKHGRKYIYENNSFGNVYQKYTN